MLDDDNIEVLDDDNNTSSSNFNNVGNNINNNDSKNLKDKIEQGKTNNQNNRSVNSQMPVGGPNNGNQFKNSGNLAKISGAAGAANSDDSNVQNQALKSAGKEAIKPIVRKGVQAATGGLVGSGPVTSKIIDKVVDKAADNPNVDKIIDDATKNVNKVKGKAVFSFIMVFIGSLSPILIIFLIFSVLFLPVFGSSINNDEKQNKYEKKYYNEMDRIVNLYNSSCEGEFNETLIGTSIFYDQIIYNDSTDIDYSDKEDSDITTSFNKKVNYKEKADDIKKLSSQLYPNFDFSDGADNSSVSACTSSYSNYKSYLNSYVKNNYKKLPDDINYDKVVDEILMIGGYSDNTIVNACSGSCKYNIDDKSVSNLMVQLLDNDGNKIEGQELIQFEKYILGVVYGEIGGAAPAEQAKTQAIAARSFALSRASVMNGAGGVKLVEEDGQWILYIRNSTNDQVYCDPDLGCSQRADGVLVSGYESVFADENAKFKPKPGLEGNADLRSYVSSVAGIVALDANGGVIVTGYSSTQQNIWKGMAEEGKSYTEILRSTYSDMVDLSDENCSSLCGHVTGDYTKWRQGNWPNVLMNRLSIENAGCLTVAVAMQVARSGVSTTLGSDFNPAILVENYRSILYDGNDNYNWYSITKVAPNFVMNSNYNGVALASMSDSEQIAFLTNGINNGCYYVVEVKTWKKGQHWVAIDTIQDGIIYMMDPASDNVDLNATVSSNGYKYRINIAKCYQVKQ